MALPAALAVGFVSLLLAACASMRETVLPADLPATWPSTPTASVDASAPDLQSWWKALGDPRLDALVDLALAQNLTLAQARSRWRAARRLAAAEGARFQPSLDAQIRTVQDAAAIDNYLHAGIDASWELGLFGQRAAVEMGARAEVADAIADEQAARVSVVAEVVHQYVVLRSARQAGMLLQRMASVDDQLLALQAVRDRLRLGSAQQRQALLLRRSRTEVAQAAPRQAAAAAAQAIAVLLAQTSNDRVPLDAGIDSGPPTVPPALRLQQVPSDLLRFRPDVRRAEAAVGRATSELSLAQVALYPRVTLGLSYVFAYNITQNRHNVNSNLPAFGLGIDIPLFDWGRRRAVADARQDSLSAALLGYRQALVEAFGETEVALAGMTNARDRADRLADGERLLARQAGLQAIRERLGLGGATERLELERAALQARLDVGEGTAACADAFVRIYKSLGGAPLEQVAAVQAVELGAAPTDGGPAR